MPSFDYLAPLPMAGKHHLEYSAPEAEIIDMENEASFLYSGDNEHTGEDDLFDDEDLA